MSSFVPSGVWIDHRSSKKARRGRPCREPQPRPRPRPRVDSANLVVLVVSAATRRPGLGPSNHRAGPGRVCARAAGRGVRGPAGLPGGGHRDRRAELAPRGTAVVVGHLQRGRSSSAILLFAPEDRTHLLRRAAGRISAQDHRREDKPTHGRSGPVRIYHAIDVMGIRNP